MALAALLQRHDGEKMAWEGLGLHRSVHTGRKGVGVCFCKDFHTFVFCGDDAGKRPWCSCCCCCCCC